MPDKTGSLAEWLKHPRETLLEKLLTPEIDALLERMPKPLGSFGYDPWGYNEDSAKLALALARLLYDRYFHVQAEGLEHIPAKGRVLIIANHAGQLPMDGVMIATALATNPHGPRAPRPMVERFFPTVPWVGTLLSSVGCVIGDPMNCAKMLENEEAIIAFPEGIRGSGKPYRKRYQLQRFGHGFMHLAMQFDTPIVPCGVIGSEETMPTLANIAPLAKLLGLPYFPLTPILLPLPARMQLCFGEPLRFSGDVRSEDDIADRVEQVKTAIRSLMDHGLRKRTRIF